MPFEKAPPALDTFRLRESTTIRYSDTDMQGRVSHAVFTVYFETGRAMLLYGGEPLNEPDTDFVLVHGAIDYRREINWPGTVDVGSRISSIGSTSFTVSQALYQNGACVATGESVMVQISIADKTKRPMSDRTRRLLEAMR